ncbi:Vacuolar protein sorting-associated protein 16 [Phytophthora boehmeriae]|uniref:Vacuolar protein sorting-associated protein 16 n=1 Tax=Phytophthora boehmeriae TaxID=109152 RepID=A0A8T1X6B3_9STRA|nr:Vacuolar protein sorting-associated protein 16 [Phytophthora boehmeriae]
MGNVWIYYAGGDEFDKAACLSSSGTPHSCAAFYTSFRRSAAKVVLQQEASGLTMEREQVQLALENWVGEASILYKPREEFPVTVAMPEELSFNADTPRQNPQKPDDGVPPTLEENILRGLCANPLSTPDSIYKVMVQLSKRLRGDEFLRVVGKYPRAARLFSSQQLNSRSDVHSSFRMNILQGNYSQAAALVGKVAFGDSAVETKRTRLKETAKLLQASLDNSTPSITSALAMTAEEAHSLSVSRSKDSFNLAMTSETLALLETQVTMEKALGLTTGLLVGNSLVETIQKLVTMHPAHRKALMLAVDCAEQYSVPPRQFWWTLLRVLARTDQWETLVALAGAIRPPIGYVAIVEVMLDDGKQELARGLLDMIQDPQELDDVATLLAEDQQQHIDIL